MINIIEKNYSMAEKFYLIIRAQIQFTIKWEEYQLPYKKSNALDSFKNGISEEFG